MPPSEDASDLCLAGPSLLSCCDATPTAWRPVYGQPPWHQQLWRGLWGPLGGCLRGVRLARPVMDSSTLFLPHFMCYQGPFRANYTHGCAGLLYEGSLVPGLTSKGATLPPSCWMLGTLKSRGGTSGGNRSIAGLLPDKILRELNVPTMKVNGYRGGLSSKFEHFRQPGYV